MASPNGFRSSMTCLADLFTAHVDERAPGETSVKDCPPYWLLATWATIWVVMLQAVEKAMRLFDHSLADDRTVLEHVLQVDQVAVVFLAVQNSQQSWKWMIPFSCALTISSGSSTRIVRSLLTSPAI